MRKVLVLLFAVLAGLACLCYSQESKRNSLPPHFPGQAPGSAQKIQRKFEGSLVGVDTNHLVVAINMEGKTNSFSFTAKTKFTRHTDLPATLRDAVMGETVEVVTEKVYDKPEEIITMNFKTN
jgi:hypothetical protein